MKLCKDCKHFHSVDSHYECHSFGYKIEPLFGYKIPALVLDPAKERDSPNMCGPDAKYFEPKNAQSI